MDSQDNLYVSDLSNHRVLFYIAGSTTATAVYGQGGNFTTAVASVSANGLNVPIGVAVNRQDNLYVADQQNNRVVFYPEGSTTATRVWGQGGNFNTAIPNNGGLSANSLSVPRRVALDPNGDVYIIDNDNNRALKYEVHDLAVVKIMAPSSLAVAPGVAVTKSVKVQFQNRGVHAEVLPNAGALGNGTTNGLIRLAVSVVDDDGELCQPAFVALDTAKNAPLFKSGPKIVKPKAKLTVNYLVTYTCNNPLAKSTSDTAPGDYGYSATVFLSELASRMIIRRTTAARAMPSPRRVTRIQTRTEGSRTSGVAPRRRTGRSAIRS